MNKPNINADFPTVDPGSFRHQISLLAPTVGTNVAGSVVTYGQTMPPTTAWVQIEYLRGSEVIKAGQDVTQAYIKVTGWWRSAFTAQSRIQLPSGAQFIVQYVENVKEMNTYMVLTCEGIGTADQ